MTATIPEARPFTATPPDGTQPPGGATSTTVVLTALGALVVAVAYAMARSGVQLALVVYWTGQCLLFLPPLVLLLARRVMPAASGLTLVLTQALAVYVVKVAYSPVQLRFPDELQHWRSVDTLLSTGKLFEANPALPVSADFPGLASVTGALVSLSGLPITAASLIIAGVSHILVVVALFEAARRLGCSVRLAALVCVLYSTELHYAFFDAMFVYQTLAVAFSAIAIWAALSLGQGLARPAPFTTIALLSSVAAVVTHHLTSVFLAVGLTLVAVLAITRGGSRSSRHVAVVAAVTVAAAITWAATVPVDIVSYAWSPVTQTWNDLTSSGLATSSGARQAPWITAVVGLGFLVSVGLGVVGWLRLRRTGRAARWLPALALGLVLYVGAIGIRFAGGIGQEAFGRAQTWVAIATSAGAAVALLELVRPRPAAFDETPTARHRHRRSSHSWRILLAAGLATSMFVAGRLGGWPAVWGTLPSGFQVSAFELSVDAPVLAAADWVRGSGISGRWYGDRGGLYVVGTTALQDPVRNGADVFYAPTVSERALEQMRKAAVTHLWVDSRIADGSSPSGLIFNDPSLVYPGQGAVPAASLTKFAQSDRFARLYDNGVIALYEVAQ